MLNCTVRCARRPAASTPGRLISAVFGIQVKPARRTTLSRRNFFSRLSTSTRALPGATRVSPGLKGKRHYHGRGLPEARSSAETLARRAVALDGADAEGRTRLANALYRQGDRFEEAN